MQANLWNLAPQSYLASLNGMSSVSLRQMVLSLKMNESGMPRIEHEPRLVVMLVFSRESLLSAGMVP